METKFEYDGRGKTLSVTDPAGRVTNYEYDNLGRRVAEVIDQKGIALRTSYEYDANGNVLTRTDANLNVSRFAYDANNRLSAKIDGAGGVTRYAFDTAGRVTRTTSYATALKLADLMPKLPQPRSTVSDTAWLLAQVQGSVNDVRTYSIYDQDGRVKLQIDGAGGVTKLLSDGNGNVVERQAYAKAVSTEKLGETPSESDLVLEETPTDRRLVSIYDAANRVTATASVVAKDGGVTQWALIKNEYDSNGNLIGRRALATAYRSNSGLAPSTKEIEDFARQNRSDSDAAQRYAYDNANRQIASAKALGPDANGVMQWAVTAQNYDAAGNLIVRTEFATALSAAGLPANADAKAYRSWLQSNSESENDRITRFGYDGANRQTISVDAMGAITRLELDGSGNVLKRFRYADIPAGYGRKATAQEILALKKDNPDSDRIESNQYDSANRLRFTQDALGYIKQMRYDGVGRLQDKIEYKKWVAAASDIGKAAQALENDDPRVTAYTYDANGNVLTVTDALHATERYGYDALGNKTSFTNKLGRTWFYDYDNMGRLKKETSPEVVAYDSNGLLATKDNLGTPTVRSLITKLDYDALGNLLARREAAGSNVERLTEYRYDAAGRQTHTIRPSLRVYDLNYDRQNGMDLFVANERDSGQLSIVVTYDVLGNAVSNKDVGGKFSHKTYDAAGRVRYEVDAAGYVTSYERDSFGATKTMIRHATPIIVPQRLSLASSDVKSLLKINASEDRALETTYDRLGRVATTREPEVALFDQNSLGSSYLTASKVTKFDYTAFGDIRQRSIYAANSSGQPLTEAAVTRSYFNKRGEKIAEIAALSDKGGYRGGYLTTFEYDLAGNLRTQVEYAGAFGTWTDYTYGTPGKSASDRTTSYTYDALNHKLTETKVGVVFADNNGSANAASRDLTTSYTYDAVGNQDSVTDALQGRTYNYYDALGRLTASAKTQLQYQSGVVTGGDQLVEFKLDIHGNAVLRIEYEQGAVSIGKDGYVASQPLNPKNRITATDFDAYGRARQVLDAVQFMQERRGTVMSYDEYGRVAKQWRAVRNGNALENSYEITRYDDLGRVTEVWTPGNANVIDQTRAPFTRRTSVYNAFGEVTSTGYAVGDGSVTEINYARYDRAGRAWISNNGDGIDKIALYDVQGNNTAIVQTSSDDRDILRRMNSAAEIQLIDKVVRTNIRYDLLGHVVDRRPAGDTSVRVLQRVDDKWVRKVLDRNQSAADSLVLLGDSGDVARDRTLLLQYRLAGSTEWINAGEPRLQILDNNPVFNTRGLAPGDYEYKVLIQTAGQAPYERETGSLRLVEDVASDPMREMVMLYMLMFGRAPENAGLNFWLKAYNTGLRRDEILQSMVKSSEAGTRFGKLAPIDVIRTIYKTALGYTDAQLAQSQSEIYSWAEQYSHAIPADLPNSLQSPDKRGGVLADMLGSVIARKDGVSKLLETRSLAIATYIRSGGSDPTATQRLMEMAVSQPTTVVEQARSLAIKESARMQLVRLYITMFGRAPDQGGFDYWINGMENGLKLEDVADAMLRSPEARTPWLYPDFGLTPEQYRQQLVTRAYSLMLNHPPSAGELADWTARLNGPNALSYGKFIVQLSEAVANYEGNDAARVNDRTLFSNKVALSYTASVTVGQVLDGEGAIALLAGVTSAATAQEAANKALLTLQANANLASIMKASSDTAVGATRLEDIRRTVARMYLMFLNRVADPTGLDYYVRINPSTPETWADIAKGFMTGQEGSAVQWASLSNSQFIATLYKNAIGYVPTGKAIENEMAHYVAELDKGKSRLEVAATLANAMLTTPQLLLDEQVHKSLLDNRTAVSLTAAQSLDLPSPAAQKAVLDLVTASDIKTALDAGYAANLDTIRLKLEAARNAAGAGRNLGDSLALAAQAGIDADAALTAVKNNPLALKRLQLTQLYVVLLNRNPESPPDAPGIEFYLSGNGVAPIETQAEHILDSDEAKKHILPTLSNREFVEKICSQILGSTMGLPDTLLAYWTNELSAAGAPSRGKMAWTILQYIVGYTDAQPSVSSLARMNARAAFLQKVSDSFAKLDIATQERATNLERVVADLKKTVDGLQTRLDSLASSKTAAETERGNAVTLAGNAVAAANLLGDRKAGARLIVMRMYALLHQRTPYSGSPQPSEIDFWIKLPPEETAKNILASAEGQKKFPSGDSQPEFIRKLYLQILNRAPTAQEQSQGLALLAQGRTNIRGELVVSIMDKLQDYANGDAAQLAYKRSIDSNIDAMMRNMSSAADQLYASAQQATAAAVRNRDSLNSLQQARYRDYIDANNRANSLEKAGREGELMLNSPYRGSILRLYAALYNNIDYDGILFYVKNSPPDLDAITAGILQDGYQVNDAEFVRRIYQRVLLRDPEPAGFDFYYDHLIHGRITRLSLAKTLMESEEAKGKFVTLIPGLDARLLERARSDRDAYQSALNSAGSTLASYNAARNAYDADIRSSTVEICQQDESNKRLAATSTREASSAFKYELAADDKAIAARNVRNDYDSVKDQLAAAQIAYRNAVDEKPANYRLSAATGGLISAATRAAASAGALQAAEGTAYRNNVAGGTAQRIVHIYLSLLDRSPTISELHVWLEHVKNSPLEPEKALVALARNLIEGDEAKSKNLFPQSMSDKAFIARIYSNAFSRTVPLTDSGVEFWASNIRGDMTRADIAVGISSGGLNVFNSDTIALNNRTRPLLQALSNATANTADVDAAIALNNRKARESAASYDLNAKASFAASPDAQRLQQLVQAYLVVLQRAPDPQGLRYYFNAMREHSANQATIANGLLDSAEGGTLYPAGQEPAQFINQLFRKAMGRDASDAEKARYTAQLASKTRGEVVVNIINDVLNSNASDLLSHTSRNLLIDKVNVALNRAKTDAANYGKSVQAAIATAEKALSVGVTTLYTVPFTPISGLSVSGQRSVGGSNLYTVDRWGNVLSSGDLRDQRYQITYTYNNNNQLLTKSHYALPSANAPAVQNRYDALGRVVATVDALGRVNRISYDSNGYQVGELHADNGKVSYEVNRFGERLSVSNYRSDQEVVKTDYTYDQMGRMLSRTTGAVDVYSWDRTSLGDAMSSAKLGELYAYDELGRRISTTNNVQWIGSALDDPNAGAKSTISYDLSGNVVQTFDAEGRATSFAYDALNRKVSELKPDKTNRMSWEYDSVGRLTKHVDLGRNETKYIYNASNQLRVASGQYRNEYGALTDQAIYYVYEDNTGNLKEIHDTALGQLSTYTYDVLGNRISEQVWSNGKKAYVQNQTLHYDRQMRLEKVNATVRGADYQVNYEFDNNGNRLKATTVFNTMLDVRKTVAVNYAYDEMNRQIQVSGNVNSYKRDGMLLRPNEIRSRESQYQMNEEDVSLAWTDSIDSAIATHDIKYDWQGNRIKDNNETYKYDAAGRLSEIQSNGERSGYRHYDSAGRVVASLDKDEMRLNAYDKSGRLEKQRMLDGSGSKIRNDVLYKYYTNGEMEQYNLFDGNGRLLQTTVNEYKLWRDSFLLTGTLVSNAGDSQSKSSVRTYDVNGNLAKAVVGDETRLFINDSAGHVLEKIEIKRNVADSVTRTLIANGEVLGSSNSTYESFSSVHESLTGGAATEDNPSTYVVQKDSENLASIAKAVWGNERLWYLIADANGMNGSETLKTGQTLTIPQRASAIYNDTTTFKPYDAAELVGNTTPELALPPPPSKGKKCGGLGQIVMIVVAVVVTYLTAGAAAHLMGAAVSAMGVTGAAAATMTAIGGAALSAAAGSIASQAVGIAIGAQDSFSWKGVALAAVSAGATQGVTSMVGGSWLGGASWQATAARAMVSNVVGQGIGNITGLQQGFNWRSVAVAGVGAAVSSSMNEELGLTKNGQAVEGLDPGAKLFKQTMSGMVSGTASAIARGGKISVTQIATDAFGNALGNGIVDALKQSVQLETVKANTSNALRNYAKNGTNAVREQLMASNPTMSQEEATEAANRPKVKFAVDILAAMGNAELAAGKRFEELSPSEQNAHLSPLLADKLGGMLTDDLGAKLADFQGGDRVEVYGRGKGFNGFVKTGANILDVTRNAMADLALAVGPGRAEAAAFGVQIAVGGIPRTALSYLGDQLFGPTKNYLGDKLSDILARRAFDINNATPQQAEDITKVSKAMGGFGIDAALGTATSVVGGALAYRYMRSGHGPAPRYETPDHLLPDNVRGDGQILYELKKASQKAPEFAARFQKPVPRHYFDKINSKASPQPQTTIIHPDMNKVVADDLAALRNMGGAYNGNTVEINGRVYGHHGREGSIYPISGDGFITLNKGEYLALKTYKSHPPERAESMLSILRDTTAADKVRALEILNWGNNPLGK
nr:DUF4214 domain-containing protein [Massilia sp. YIM B04103]